MSSFTYEGTLIELREAYCNRAWLALGYESWEAYVEAEHGFAPLRQSPGAKRQAVVRELREAGLSTRAIAAAIGVNNKTVSRDMQASPELSNIKVTGIDGRSINTKAINADRSTVAESQIYYWDGRPSVYFIANSRSGAIKIGHSINPVARLKGLQTASPDILTILGHAPGTVADEHRLHLSLQRHRLQGEWFKPHREVEAAMYYFLTSREADSEFIRSIEARHSQAP